MRVFFCTVMVTVLAIGCAAPIQNLTRTQYVNQAFSPTLLSEGGLALFPITAGQGQEGYRRPLGQYLNQHLNQAVPNGLTLPWEVTMDSLNRHGLVSEYQQLIESYHQTAIIDRERVKRLEIALGVRFALYCALQDYSEESRTSYNVLTGYQTSRTANVSAHCLILDLHTGDVMQEILGRAASVASEFEYNSPYEAYASTIARSVLAQIPGSVVGRQQYPAKR